MVCFGPCRTRGLCRCLPMPTPLHPSMTIVQYPRPSVEILIHGLGPTTKLLATTPSQKPSVPAAWARSSSQHTMFRAKRFDIHYTFSSSSSSLPFFSILARRQDSSPRLPPSTVFTHAHVRLGCKTGCQGYLQRDPYSQRGCSLHATLPSLHLRHERVDRPPAPLLHGL